MAKIYKMGSEFDVVKPANIKLQTGAVSLDNELYILTNGDKKYTPFEDISFDPARITCLRYNRGKCNGKI